MMAQAKLARAVDVMMAQAKRIYILMIKEKKFFSFLFVAVFSKRNRKHVLRVSIEFYIITQVSLIGSCL